MTKAIALTSGGLDSILAAKLIMEQGIEVIGLCFKSAFFGPKNAEKMAAQIDMPLIVVDFTDDHLNMTKNPKHGYGKNMNPCIDCHAMMLRYAGKMIDELRADFIITGEVLNQRPMSQNKKSLDLVKKESGFDDKVLRPLSAKCLLPTKMEEEGLVDRERLLDLSGKSRKPQMELAKKWGIVEYPTPAGGCMLTEPQFAAKLRDLYTYEKDSITPWDIELIKLGRHMRLSENVKLISSRNKEEYDELMSKLKDHYILINTANHSGSTVILVPKIGYEVNTSEILRASAIAARYSKGKDEESVAVKYKKVSDSEYRIINIQPIKDEEIKELMLT